MIECGDRLLFASAQGLVAIAFVGLITLCFRKLTPNAKAWLWRVSFLRFLVALGWEWHAPILPAEPAPVATTSYSYSMPLVSTSAPVVDAPPTVSPWLIAWLTVAGVLFIIGLVRFIRVLGIARAARTVASDVRASDDISVPCLVGLWRGLILLPSALLHPNRAEDCAMAIAHETAHRDRRDPLFGLLNFLTACLFWFVLPVWFALREYAVQVEMDCDQRALRSTRLSPRRYGGLLVALATQSPLPVGALSMAGPRSGLSRRLQAMKTPIEKPKMLTLALVGLFGALIIVPIRPVAAAAAQTVYVVPSQTVQALNNRIQAIKKQLPKSSSTSSKKRAALEQEVKELDKIVARMSSQKQVRAPGAVTYTFTTTSTKPATTYRVTSVERAKPAAAPAVASVADVQAAEANAKAAAAEARVVAGYELDTAEIAKRNADREAAILRSDIDAEDAKLATDSQANKMTVDAARAKEAQLAPKPSGSITVRYVVVADKPGTAVPVRTQKAVRINQQGTIVLRTTTAEAAKAAGVAHGDGVIVEGKPIEVRMLTVPDSASAPVAVAGQPIERDILLTEGVPATRAGNVIVTTKPSQLIVVGTNHPESVTFTVDKAGRYSIVSGGKTQTGTIKKGQDRVKANGWTIIVNPAKSGSNQSYTIIRGG